MSYFWNNLVENSLGEETKTGIKKKKKKKLHLAWQINIYYMSERSTTNGARK